MLQDVSFRIKNKKKWQKNNKRNIKSYQPVCLISIRRELFIFNKIFSLFLGNNFTSPKQSGFKPGYSCINELFFITFEIYKSYDDGLEVRSVSWTFLRLSIKSGTRELFFKLKENGVSGELLHIISNFLSYRKQRVVLNGQMLSWNNVQASDFNVYTNFFNLYKQFIWGLIVWSIDILLRMTDSCSQGLTAFWY